MKIKYFKLMTQSDFIALLYGQLNLRLIPRI